MSLQKLEGGTEYFLIEGGTISGQDVLVHKNFYTFSRLYESRDVCTWKCTKKGCLSLVNEISDCFVGGSTPHNHPGCISDVLIVKVFHKVSPIIFSNLFLGFNEIMIFFTF